MSRSAQISSERIVEALIFASPEPVPPSKLAKIASLPQSDVPKVVERLNAEYDRTGRPFEVRLVGGGYALYLKPEFSPWVDELVGRHRRLHLTRSMFEVLAIVAIKQPVTKPVIDKIRGVNSAAPIFQLLKQGLITIKGRERSPGRPFLYATTNKFLRVFGLDSIESIPSFEELQRMFGEVSG